MPNTIGFQDAAFQFYEELAADNSRQFWTANRDRYEALVRDPMLALLDALADEFGPGKLFRPNRDIRFSPDKRPYKEHQGGYVGVGQSCGYYVHVDPVGLMTGGGWYSGTPEQIARYRSAVDEPRLLSALQDALTEARGAGLDVGGDKVRTRPRGVSADDPNLELLRHRSLTIGRRHPRGESVLGDERLEELVRQSWRASRGLVEWLAANVVEGTAGP